MGVCTPKKLANDDRAVVDLRVPHLIGGPLAVLLTWFVGVFLGRWMFGYRGSYEEYYHEASE